MHRRTESGVMLTLWAMFALIVVTGFLFAGMETLKSSSRDAETRFRSQGQAVDVARAGVVDAYAWFRRQPSQPVTTFAPRRDLTTVPPTNDTDDPAIGIVREFEISPGYYGRYEVRRFADLDGNGRADPGEGTSDLTTARGFAGTGAGWYVESRGIVYRRVDPALPWNVEPNQRVAGAVVATEIRRMNLVPPGTAALCSSRGDRASLGSRGRIDGNGAAGILFPPSTGTPTVVGTLVGVPTYGAVAGYDASFEAVFGLTADDLKAVANVRIPAGQPLPATFPEYGIVFVEGDLTVTNSAPLTGTGILVVQGDLDLAAGSNSYFSGLVYVTGDYSQSAPSMMRGTVVVLGSSAVQGGSDVSELVYDRGVLDTLLQEVGSYRISRAIRRQDVDAVEGVR